MMSVPNPDKRFIVRLVEGERVLLPVEDAEMMGLANHLLDMVEQYEGETITRMQLTTPNGLVLLCWIERYASKVSK